MALENILQELGVKLDANTVALKAAVAAGVLPSKAPPVSAAASRDPDPDDDEVTQAVADSPANKPRGAGRPPKNPPARVYTAHDVAAAAGKVKEELGIDKAKALIAEYAGAGKKLADIPEKKFGAFAAAAEALIAAGAALDEEPDDEM